MAVTLPSDLVADVMRAADPARLASAQAKLRSTGGDAPADFAAVLNPVPTRAANTAAASDPYQGFERMVLRNLFETLLPQESSGAFGGGPSVGVWRSLAADQLAGVYADSGGIGIARMLRGPSEDGGGEAQGAWPYFSADKIEAFTG